jgi:citronellol/citronellal dehydrogenase
MNSTLNEKTIVMSGGSRGIGLAIALRAAEDGANVVLLAKTDSPNPKLEGTVHSAAAQIEAQGGRALAVVGDVRNDADVSRAVELAVQRFGGIDIVVNNASALDLRTTVEIDMKKYDLMLDINVRGTFLLSKTCLPHLERSSNPHILTLSPPLDLRPKWAGSYLAYTIAKYGMSLVTLGLAEELKGKGIAANSLWPRTTIATAAVRNLLGGEDMIARSRTVDIMSDAAHAILTQDASKCTGNFFLDEEVLAGQGVADFSAYRATPGDGPLESDLFLDPLA